MPSSGPLPTSASSLRAFFWTHALGQLVNGRLGEFAGPTRIIFIGAVGSVAANLLISLQSSLWIMAVVWGINGYFQSMCWTPGIAALARWWPGASRGFASGFATAFSGFGQCGVTLAVAAAFTLFPDMGWQAAFVVPMAFPLVFAFVFLALAKDSPADCGLPQYQESDPQRSSAERELKELERTHGVLYPYKYLLYNKMLAIWVFIAFMVGLVRFGLVTWVPLYFVQEFGMDISAGLVGSVALPLGMAAGSLSVPSLTDRFCPNNRLVGVIASCCVAVASIAALCLLGPAAVEHFAFVEVALFFAGFSVYAIEGLLWTFAADVGGRVFTGTASGILNCSVYLGAACQSLFYGALLESVGWSTVIASMAALCALVGAVAAISSRRLG